ncbi:QWRF motif-containing protein 2 [Hibiscus syriacus]|uniref:QWRF motif-containing protein 2 n=1 Tax=Hibiscus syriacus TaxID=106335 RepID=A0A6A3AVN1_HIBSY|nr:QWRF motif-containing protein 2-like [Hibiscus syriacus]KAE8708416.1 QWRF motif-containing protein 2 [Hibiscus syriacus]
MMVAALSRPPTPSHSSVEEPQQETNTHQRENPTVGTAKRSPLKDNGSTVTRKPRVRQVSSRYLSPSPSTSSSAAAAAAAKTPARFPSPLNSRSTNTMSMGSKTATRFHSPLVSRSTNASSTSTTSSLLHKRSQSVDRRRPGSQLSQGNNVNGTAEMSAATKMLITSTRSLSVSFQGEAYSLPISKTKAPVGSTLIRKVTPERRRATPLRDHGENSKPADQQLWPGRTRQMTPGSGSASNPLHRSLVCGSERKVFGSGAVLAKSLQQSVMLDESVRRVSFDGGSRLSLDLGSSELIKEANKQNPDSNSLNEAHCELAASDTDSISSGSTNSGTGRSGNLKGKNGLSNIAVSARFWQETNSRLRWLQDPGSPLSSSPGSRIGSPAKFSQSRRISCDGAVASPMRRSIGPASPSKLWTSSSSSPSRGLSPGRVRNAVGSKEMSGTAVNTPSILSFSVDIRRGKKGEDRIVDAHMLRLFYNGYLQWRFANSRADATFITLKLSAEKNLWNARVTTSELRHSVTLKRIKLLLLRQKLNLTSILKRQIAHLEVWALLERDHSSSLLGATEALKASTLRLPIVGKATVDIQNLKDAVSSAIEMMQAMASSVFSLSSKVEEMNSLVAELVSLAAKEKVLLERCKEFLSTIASIQVKDCSLRSRIVQVNRISTTSNLTTHV